MFIKILVICMADVYFFKIHCGLKLFKTAPWQRLKSGYETQGDIFLRPVINRKHRLTLIITLKLSTIFYWARTNLSLEIKRSIAY